MQTEFESTSELIRLFDTPRGDRNDGSTAIFEVRGGFLYQLDDAHHEQIICVVPILFFGIKKRFARR